MYRYATHKAGTRRSRHARTRVFIDKGFHKNCSNYQLCRLNHYRNALLPRGTSTLWPELLQPLVRVLWDILVQDLAFKVGKVVARQVVQRVLLIWTGSNSVWDGLNVVSDFLVDPALDVYNLRVLDAVLVAVVG